MRAASGSPYQAVARKHKSLRVTQKGERESAVEDRTAGDSAEDKGGFQIKRPGALNAAVGGPASKKVAEVRHLAANGTPLQKKQAEFYLNILRPANGGK